MKKARSRTTESRTGAGEATSSELTPRQRQILDFIDSYRQAKGFPPTVREIQKAVGLHSTSSVHAQLKNLESSGHIVREPSKPRALGLSREESTAQQSWGHRPASEDALGVGAARRGDNPAALVPLVGRVAAGSLVEAIESPDDLLAVQWDLFPEVRLEDVETGRLFVLRIKGDSMVGAGIHDNDLVLVRRQPTARSGEVVVALIGGEATVKRLRISRSKVTLEAENPFYDPIEIDPAELEIVGKVVGLIRTSIGAS